MNSSPQCWAVIPAAGIGERVGLSIPKQYLQIAGKTILEHAIQPFISHSCVKGITVALNPNDTQFESLSIYHSCAKLHFVEGGETRAHSVLNALQSVEAQIDRNDFVLVHDAARPCLTASDLDKLINKCLSHKVGGILGSKVSDTIKQVEAGKIINTLDRGNIWRAFTPQMFKLGLLQSAIKKAFDNNIVITDESSAIEYAGYTPCMIEGDAGNIKVTTAEDIALAEFFLTKDM